MGNNYIICFCIPVKQGVREETWLYHLNKSCLYDSFNRSEQVHQLILFGTFLTSSLLHWGAVQRKTFQAVLRGLGNYIKAAFSRLILAKHARCRRCRLCSPWSNWNSRFSWKCQNWTYKSSQHWGPRELFVRGFCLFSSHKNILKKSSSLTGEVWCGTNGMAWEGWRTWREIHLDRRTYKTSHQM